MNPLLDGLIYNNFVEATREFGRWGSSNQLIEQDGLMCIIGGTTYPIFTNCVTRLDRQIPAEEVVTRAKSWFQPLARNFTIYTYGDRDRDLEKYLNSAQLQQLFDTPVMVLDSEVELPALPASVEIKVAASEKEILDARYEIVLVLKLSKFPKNIPKQFLEFLTDCSALKLLLTSPILTIYPFLLP